MTDGRVINLAEKIKGLPHIKHHNFAQGVNKIQVIAQPPFLDIIYKNHGFGKLENSAHP
jgi:hypothetical protein